MTVFQGTFPPGEEPFPDFTGPEHPCFFCGTALGYGDIVMWSGCPAYLYLHPNCVPTFCRNILEDWDRVNGSLPMPRPWEPIRSDDWLERLLGP